MVNVNIIQKNDGTGNFIDNEETRERFRLIFSWINCFYQRYSPSDTIEWVTELPNYDSRIRFSIGESGQERIYFYQNSNWWNYYNSTNCDSITDYLEDNYPERLDAINLYILGNPNGELNFADTRFPSATNFQLNQVVAAHYWQLENDWAISMLLAHEFGHTLGLFHTYLGGGASAICDQDNPEFLRDIFVYHLPNSCNCPHEVIYDSNAYAINGDGITNNLMGGNNTQVYISPMQAGQMHRSLALYSVRKYVQCEKSNVPLVITDNQLWDFDMKLYQDLIIENNATLILTCHLVMHPDAKIIVKPGGKLIIDGALIGTDLFDNGFWPGIEVWGDVNAHQFPDHGNYLQGYLELKNGATIENAVCAVELWRPNDYGSMGGIIMADSAFFINNAKAVHGLHYTNFNPYTDRPASYTAAFNRCSFVINSQYLGSEIAAYDAGFNVNSYCNNGAINPCPDECLVHSSFSGFYDAVYSIHTGSTIKSFVVQDALFSNNDIGIFALNILCCQR